GEEGDAEVCKEVGSQDDAQGREEVDPQDDAQGRKEVHAQDGEEDGQEDRKEFDAQVRRAPPHREEGLSCRRARPLWYRARVRGRRRLPAARRTAGSAFRTSFARVFLCL